MAEYIDREALRKFPIRANHCNKAHADENFVFGIEAVLEYAEHIPTVDAAEVVRCGQCRWRGSENCAMFYRCDCGAQHTWETDNDFCSYGERRCE